MRYSISFTVPKATRIFLLLLSSLFLTGLCANYLRWSLHYETAMGFIPLFDLDGEYNLPALFSVGLIASNAVLLSFVARHKAVATKDRKYWRAFSFLFAYLAMDEFAGLHERLGGIVHRLAPHLLPFGSTRFWIAPMGLLLVFFTVYFFRFFWSLPAKIKVNFLVAGLVYVTGAVGIELLGDVYMWNRSQADFTYGLLSCFEELGEMLGMFLFLRQLLLVLQSLSNTKQFSLSFIAEEDSGQHQLLQPEISVRTSVNVLSEKTEN